jgi:PEP-CTERM motif-containing protein
MKTRFTATAIAGALAASLAVFASQAYAGPIIIDGTDAEEHGSVSGGVNTAGWEYFQRGFENLLPQVGNGNTVALCLGCTGNTQTAFASAFDLATKPAGWTRATIDGDVNMAAYFAGTDASGRTLANTGLLYFPTGGNTSGGLTDLEMAVLNANALNINTFVGGAGNPSAGGGLFAHGEGNTTDGWGWLTTLIPGIVPTESGGGANLALTPVGVAAFPGLTNADVNAGTPWHNHFAGSFGGLSVLVETTDGPAGRAVIIGGGAGTLIACGLPGQPSCPTQLPEPGTLALMAFGALGLAGLIRRRKS